MKNIVFSLFLIAIILIGLFSESNSKETLCPRSCKSDQPNCELCPESMTSIS